MRLARLIIVVGLLALAGGCMPLAPEKYVAATGKVSEDLSLIHKSVSDTIPISSGELRGRLMSILNITESAIKLVPALEQGAANYAKEVERNAVLVADFWSVRQRALFWWCFAGFWLVVIGLGIAYSLGGAAVTSGVLGVVGKVFYYGFHVVTLGIFAVFSKLKTDIASVASTSNAVKMATAAANRTGEVARVAVTDTAHVTATPQITPLPAATAASALAPGAQQDQPISLTPIG